MRTAVIRINVDPGGTLSDTDVESGVAQVLAGVSELGMRLVHPDLGSLPSSRRELQFLGAGEDPAAGARSGRGLCRRAFGSRPPDPGRPAPTRPPATAGRSAWTPRSGS